MECARKWLAEITHCFADLPVVGVVMVVILAVGGCILEGRRAVFRRPTIADWNPRRMEVQEALHLVATDSVLRLAIPEVRYSLCKYIYIYRTF